MNALLSVLAYVIIILIGLTLRSAGVFPRELVRPIGLLVMNVTLPSAIITALNGVELPFNLLLLILLPIAATWLLIFVAWFLTRRRADAVQAAPFAMLNMTGYNIGNFAMPFTMGLVSPLGFLAVCLFDVGNSIMCTGGTYAFACRGQGALWDVIKRVAKTLSRSVPLWTYIVVLTLSTCHLQVPKEALHVFTVIGNANAFLSMLFIGLSINVKLNLEGIGPLLRMMLVRYLINGVIAVAAFFLLPFALDVRQAIAIVLMAPLPVMAVIFTMKAQLDWESAALINSLSVLVSIVIMCTLLVIFSA